jgi:hypothetical protein
MEGGLLALCSVLRGLPMDVAAVRVRAERATDDASEEWGAAYKLIARIEARSGRVSDDELSSAVKALGRAVQDSSTAALTKAFGSTLGV